MYITNFKQIDYYHYYYWVRGRAIRKGIDFPDIAIRNGFNFSYFWYEERYWLGRFWYEQPHSQGILQDPGDEVVE